MDDTSFVPGIGSQWLGSPQVSCVLGMGAPGQQQVQTNVMRPELQRANVDFSKDGVGYRQLVLHLSDKEFAEMVAALNTAIGPFLAYGSRPGRKRRAFATVLMPLDDSS